MGASIIDVTFDGIGCSAKKIDTIILKKGNQTFTVGVWTELVYGEPEASLEVCGEHENVEEMISMPSECDDCKNKRCKDRSKPGAWVVKCKIKGVKS